MDSLVYFGDALKALDDSGKIGGYLVRFSNGTQKDLSGEYFTADTFLGSRDGDGVDTIFHHGQPIPVKASLPRSTATELAKLQERVFAPVKTTRDAIGVFAETVLNMADEYEKAVFSLVKAGKLGWSSGAVGHLVKKESDGRITRWPIGEASITPCPCEPLNRAVPIKSLDAVKFQAIEDDDEPATIPNKPTGLAAKLNQHIDDLIDDKGTTREIIIAKMAKEASIQVEWVKDALSGDWRGLSDSKLKAFSRVLEVDFESLKAAQRRDHLKTIKGMFEEALAAELPDRWKLECVYAEVVKKLAYAASGAQMAGVEFDLQGKLAEATTEYSARLQEYALAEVTDWLSEAEGEDFYLKAIVKADKDILSGIPIDLSDHSELLVSGLKSVLARFRGNHEQRVKAGRVLSEKNRQRIATLLTQMKAIADDFESLLSESQPMADATAKRAAITNHLLRKAKHRALTLGV